MNASNRSNAQAQPQQRQETSPTGPSRTQQCSTPPSPPPPRTLPHGMYAPHGVTSPWHLWQNPSLGTEPQHMIHFLFQNRASKPMVTSQATPASSVTLWPPPGPHSSAWYRDSALISGRQPGGDLNTMEMGCSTQHLAGQDTSTPHFLWGFPRVDQPWKGSAFLEELGKLQQFGTAWHGTVQHGTARYSTAQMPLCLQACCPAQLTHGTSLQGLSPAALSVPSQGCQVCMPAVTSCPQSAATQVSLCREPASCPTVPTPYHPISLSSIRLFVRHPFQ